MHRSVNHRFALVLLAGLVTAGAAGGEPLADHDVVELEGLVPREVIERVLARRGLKPEQDLVLRGAMYSVIATANQGYRARVVIDARNGEIVGFRVVDRARGSERRADVKD